jgi:PAS domain S-box-containing protein
MPSGKILLLEDDEHYASSIIIQLNKIGYAPSQVLHCTALPQIQLPDAADITVVLAGLCLKGHTGKQVFTHVQKKFPFTPVVILTCEGEMDFAIDSLHLGAQDYLLQGSFDEKVLEKTMLYAIERKKSVNDFKRLFADSPGPMYIYAFGTHEFLAVNTAALSQYGYTEEEFLNLNATDIRPEEEMKRFHEVQQAITGNYYDAGQWRHKRSNGEVFYVHVYVHRTEFESRKAVVVLALDIDNKVKAEQENNKLNNTIREQKEQMDAILSAIPEVIWSRRADNQEILYINDAAKNVYGIAPEELLGTTGPLIDNIYPDDRPKLEAAIKQTMNEGKGHCEYRIVHRDGTVRYVFDEAICYPGEDGKPGVIMGIAIDITQHKEQLQQIEKQNEQLREIGWLQSHQVRGPLATILGLSQLIDKDNPANPGNQELLGKLQEAAQLLDSSIQQVVQKTYTNPGSH